MAVLALLLFALLGWVTDALLSGGPFLRSLLLPPSTAAAVRRLLMIAPAILAVVLSRAGRGRPASRRLLEGYRRAVEASALTALADPDGVVRHVNRKLCEATGYAREELEGRRLDEIFGAELPTLERSPSFFHGGGSWHAVSECRTRSGHRARVDLTVIPVLDDEGRPLHLIAVGHDISSLTDAFERADAAGRATAHLIARLGPEIRTPLTGLVGFLDLLDRSRLDPPQGAYVRNGLLSAKVLTGIISDIQALALMERGGFELEEVPFAPREELESTVELFAASADERAIELAAFVDPALPRSALGDPLRLREIVTSLLGNALRLTSGGGSILLEARRTSESPCRVLFSVTDTGSGMQEERRTAILEALSQPDLAVAADSVGLGLAMAARLVRLMGGELALEAAEDGGNRFAFELEMSSLEPPEPSRSLADIGGEAVVLAGGGWSRTAGVAAELLQAYGARVRPCDDARQAEGAALLVVLADEEAEARVAAALRSAAGTPLVVIAPPAQRGRIEPALDSRGRVICPPLSDSKLRLAVDDLLHGPRQLIERLGPAQPAGPRLRGTVLVAEDNRINQKLLAIRLEELGLEVEIAADGLEAVSLFLRGLYDLVLMDVSMPFLGGVEAAKKMRDRQASAGVPRTPIVALTAHALRGDRERLLQSGMDDYLPKPIDFGRLDQLIRRYIPAAEGAEQPGDARPAVPAANGSTSLTWQSVTTATGLEKQDAERLVRLFFEEAEAELAQLEEAAGLGDASALFREAHRLKGAAASLRLASVAEAARRIEQIAIEGRPDPQRQAPPAPLRPQAGQAPVNELKKEIRAARQALLGAETTGERGDGEAPLGP